MTVATYGSSTDFPAFYSPTSGFKVRIGYSLARTLSEEDRAAWRSTRQSAPPSLYVRSYGQSPAAADCLSDQAHQLNLQSGILFGVPIPAEHAHEAATIQQAVDQAVAESEANGMSRRGKEVTPWLLDRVRQLTAGRSVLSSASSVTPQIPLIAGRHCPHQEQCCRGSPDSQGIRRSTRETGHPSVRAETSGKTCR